MSAKDYKGIRPAARRAGVRTRIVKKRGAPFYAARYRGRIGIPIGAALGIALLILTVTFVLNLMNSRAGRAITAIRDDDIAARSIGINLTKYKLMAFVSSAVIAGFAGVLYALNFASLVAKKFDYNLSINILVMVVLGGMGSIPGAIIAAVVLTVLPELLRGFSQYRMFIYSIVLIVMMLFNRAPAFVMWRQRLALKLRSGKAGTGTGDAGKKKG